MNRNLKRAIKEAFDAPEPTHKKEFLARYSTDSYSTISLILTQVGFIQKWVWISSILVFLYTLVKCYQLDTELLWTLSAMTPFIALAILTENARSTVYKMAELEMGCRFSLKTVILARMGIVAFSHLILLCVLMLLTYRNSSLTFLQSGVYLLVPYLLTTFVGLFFSRKLPGKESLYGCMGIAVCISYLNVILHELYQSWWALKNWKWWVLTLILLFILSGIEIRKSIKQIEEFA